MKKLRLILGDQLNLNHSWFRSLDSNITYLLMEVRSETDYVRHHIKKVVAFFLSMRSFAEELQSQGHSVIYLKLNDTQNRATIPENILRLLEAGAYDQLEYQLPDEYRLDVQLKAFTAKLDIPVKVYDTEHFLTERDFLARFFKGKKTFLMESFYRHMRKEYQVLMETNGGPVGGEWNYDQQNRAKYKGKEAIPRSLDFNHPAGELIDMLKECGVKTIGRMETNALDWPITRKEGLVLLDYFIQSKLSNFGTYQDAMVTDQPFLWHSRLSFLLNAKILHPLEIVRAVEEAWKRSPESYSLNQVEGFIRQIIGWREYMRGIYWAKMPEYSTLNFFDHKTDLPGWFWNGETKMNCLSQAIGQSLDLAYAHHIQRLMVTGNFALLAGIDPDQVDEWYLGIYIDAIEWVEITNTRGMSQFADGGIVGTKPYVSSANYMHKMGDYCNGCHYDRKRKTGDKACPFNSLYWDFYDRNRPRLEKNPRIGMMYRTWDKMDPEKRAEILLQASTYKADIENL